MFVITTDDDGFNRDVACDVVRLVRNYESVFLLSRDIRPVNLRHGMLNILFQMLIMILYESFIIITI